MSNPYFRQENIENLHVSRIGHLAEVLEFWRVRFISPTKLLTKPGLEIYSEADLFQRLISYLYESGNIKSDTPVGYWKPLVERVILTEKKKNLVNLAAVVAFNPAAPASRVEEFARLISKDFKPVDGVALKQFIWQVKRKLTGQKVVHHLMPILWGASGSGKSEAAKKLLEPIAGHVLQGVSLDKVGDDKYYRGFDENLVCFFDEMPRAEKASVELIKQVITAETMNGRLLYTNTMHQYQQRCTFLGTSNIKPGLIINDPTSFRRFWGIEAPQRMDWEAVSSFPVLELWQSVNENEECHWMKEYAADFMAGQEEHRTRTPFEMFVFEGFIEKPAAPVSEATPTFIGNDAYQLFQEFCENSGYRHVLTKHNFYKELEVMGCVRVEGLMGRAARFPTFAGKLHKNPVSNVVALKGLK